MSCAAVGQKRLFEPIQNVCVHKRGRQVVAAYEEFSFQPLLERVESRRCPLMSLSLAGCSTPEPR